MLANLLIGLREGLEATVVVSILIAFLVKTGRRDLLPAVRRGVVLAVLLPVAAAVALALTAKELTFAAQELLGGGLSIVAVGFVTWMVFWMRATGAALRTELHERMRAAAAVGAGAVALTAFLAVGREGLETVLFVSAAAQASGQTWQPLVGAVVGLALAVVLGRLLYRQVLRIDLRRFFTWTGAALVVVAAGVLSYGVHDLQEAGVLPGLQVLAFDVSRQVPPGSWYGALLKGVLNVTPATTVLQAVAWAAYVVPVLALYLRPRRTSGTSTAVPGTGTVTTSTTAATAAPQDVAASA